MKTIAVIQPPALEARPEDAEAFQALAHLTRLRIFFYLVRAGREAPAGEIQEALEVPAPTLSHHLDALYRASLLERRHHERFIYYSVNQANVSRLVRLLTACC